MSYYDRDGNPVDFEQWAQLMEDDEYRRVGGDELEGEVWVSTIWLGIDHSFSKKGPPILFETMVFGGVHDSEQVRYSTRDEAILGHMVMVDRVMAEQLQEES